MTTFAAFTQLPEAFASFAHAPDPTFLQMGWDGGHMGDGWGWGGWLLMSVLVILCVGTFAAVGIFFVRSTSSHSHPASGSSALDVARDRYARGEISEEEFQRIKRGLS